MPDGAPVQEEAAPTADRIPVVGSVAAGSPILAEECIEDYLTFDTGGREGEYFALRVRGESMLNAGILPDDLVVVHRQPTAHNGEIVVALLGDEATVKRLSRRNGEVWLLPENENYRPIDGREATLLGKVTAARPTRVSTVAESRSLASSRLDITWRSRVRSSTSTRSAKLSCWSKSSAKSSRGIRSSRVSSSAVTGKRTRPLRSRPNSPK